VGPTLRLALREWLRPRTQPECPSHQRGVLGPRHIVQLAHGGLNVSVAHPLLDSTDVRLADHASPKGMAQIMEAK